MDQVTKTNLRYIRLDMNNNFSFSVHHSFKMLPLHALVSCDTAALTGALSAENQKNQDAVRQAEGCVVVVECLRKHRSAK